MEGREVWAESVQLHGGRKYFICEGKGKERKREGEREGGKEGERERERKEERD